MFGVSGADSLKTAASKLAKYSLTSSGSTSVRWDKGGSEPADDLYIFYANGNGNPLLGTDFFMHKGIRSAVMRVESITV
jgi:hypothetical protein